MRRRDEDPAREDAARCRDCFGLPGRCDCVVLGLKPPLARKAPRQPVDVADRFGPEGAP